jgi:hypothetical protein
VEIYKMLSAVGIKSTKCFFTSVRCTVQYVSSMYLGPILDGMPYFIPLFVNSKTFVKGKYTTSHDEM